MVILANAVQTATKRRSSAASGSGRQYGEMTQAEEREMRKKSEAAWNAVRRAAHHAHHAEEEFFEHEELKPENTTGFQRKHGKPGVYYALSLNVLESGGMREDAVQQWMEIVDEQLQSLSEESFARILELSSAGKSAREITRDPSLDRHGLAVATVETIIKDREEGGDQEEEGSQAKSRSSNAAGGEAKPFTVKRAFKAVVGRSFKSFFRSSDKGQASPKSQEDAEAGSGREEATA